MNLKMEKELNYAHVFLVNTNGISSKSPNAGFRDRFEHTKRVFM